jgi:hypothetical protein
MDKGTLLLVVHRQRHLEDELDRFGVPRGPEKEQATNKAQHPEIVRRNRP